MARSRFGSDKDLLIYVTRILPGPIRNVNMILYSGTTISNDLTFV
jgi:hypothetical protein